MEPSPELVEELHKIYAAISDGDLESLGALVSDGAGMVFIGTDPDEWFDDTAAIRDMLRAQASAGVRIRPGPIVAFQEGTVGWAADRGTFLLPDGTEAPFRMTIVLHRENGAWTIVQEHASFGVPNEEALGVEL